MTLSKGSITSNSPSGAFSDLIKALCGTTGLANWSFVENIPAGTQTSEQQTITLTDWGAGDSFKMTYDGVETGAVSYAADVSAAITAALNAILPFNTYKDCATARTNASNYIITFSGDRVKGTTMPYQISITSTVGCSGSVAVTQTAITTTGSASYSCDVFKCAGTGTNANDAGVDWYLGIARYGEYPATYWNVSGANWIMLAESYDSTTKRFSKFVNSRAGSLSSSSVCSSDDNGYGTHGANYIQNSVNPCTVLDISGTGTWFKPTLNGTGFYYWIVMTNNLLSISFKVGNTESWSYFGLMDSMVDAAIGDTLPLVMLASNGPQKYGGFTKLPGVGVTAGITSSFGAWPIAWNSCSSPGTGITQGCTDFWKDQKVDVCRVMIYQNIAAASIYVWGYVRGLLKDEVMCIYAGGSVILGDTLTIGSDTWTVIGVDVAGSIHLISKG